MIPITVLPNPAALAPFTGVPGPEMGTPQVCLIPPLSTDTSVVSPGANESVLAPSTTAGAATLAGDRLASLSAMPLTCNPLSVNQGAVHQVTPMTGLAAVPGLSPPNALNVPPIVGGAPFAATGFTPMSLAPLSMSPPALPNFTQPVGGVGFHGMVPANTATMQATPSLMVGAKLPPPLPSPAMPLQGLHPLQFSTEGSASPVPPTGSHTPPQAPVSVPVSIPGTVAAPSLAAATPPAGPLIPQLPEEDEAEVERQVIAEREAAGEAGIIAAVPPAVPEALAPIVRLPPSLREDIYPGPRQLIVNGLSRHSTAAALYEALGRFGEVRLVRIIVDRSTGASRCFAFVHMSTPEAAAAAVAGAANVVVCGRALKIAIALPQRPPPTPSELALFLRTRHVTW